MTTLYHNPRCKKSREALQLLNDANEPIEIILYLKDTPSITTLKEVITSLNIAPITLVRKNEALWKELYQDMSLTDEEIIKAMHKHPKLIERPIAIKNKNGVIGRPPERVLELLS